MIPRFSPHVVKIQWQWSFFASNYRDSARSLNGPAVKEPQRILKGTVGGGTTMFPFFEKRLQNELKNLCAAQAASSVNVVASANRNFAVWQGAKVIFELQVARLLRNIWNHFTLLYLSVLGIFVSSFDWSQNQFFDKVIREPHAFDMFVACFRIAENRDVFLWMHLDRSILSVFQLMEHTCGLLL